MQKRSSPPPPPPSNTIGSDSEPWFGYALLAMFAMAVVSCVAAFIVAIVRSFS